MNPWTLTDSEWDRLRGNLLPPGHGRRAGRPRTGDRAAAEAGLFRHFHSRSPGGRCFGWNELPREFGISPATANRRFGEWLESGAWEAFWDALLDLRHGPGRGREWARPPARRADSPLGSPVQTIVADLERAFCFLNARLFGGTLPRAVRITLEDRRSREAGSFCAGRWRLADGPVGHIMVSTDALGGGKELALAVLLHEMVHCRNHQAGLPDCSREQYHNRHFRDSAILAGLVCSSRDAAVGYAATRLGPRGFKQVRAFRHADEGIFDALDGGRSGPAGAVTDLPAD